MTEPVSQSPSRKDIIDVEAKPTVRKMTFDEAMREVIKGAHVTKLEWDDPEVEVYLDTTLKIKLSNSKAPNDLIVSDADMKGNDWVIVSSPAIIDVDIS